MGNVDSRNGLFEEEKEDRKERYYMIERKGEGIRYYQRARQRQDEGKELVKSAPGENRMWVKIAWQRYYFNEGSLSHPDEKYYVDEIQRAETPPYNKYINFNQTVGMPERFFKLNQEVICQDSAGRPLEAVIRSIEKNYYHIVYTDKNAAVQTPYEWVHRNSSRLKRKADLGGPSDSEGKKVEIFDQLRVGMYVEALYPPEGVLLDARIVEKLVGDGGENDERDYIVVQFASYKLCQQKVVYRRDVSNRRVLKTNIAAKHGKEENKARKFISALMKLDLIVVPIDKNGGHSMFRALSHQLFGTQTNWKAIRTMCCDHMVKHKEYFQHFLDCEFEEYRAAKLKAITEDDFYAPGDHLDLQCICEMFDCGIKVYSDKALIPFEHISFYADESCKFQTKHKVENILLFYRGEEEYDSIIVNSRPNPVPLKRKIGFDKHSKNLGELEPGDIKGDILKARNEEFERWKSKRPQTVVPTISVSTYEGLCKWHKKGGGKAPVSYTVDAMIKLCGFKRNETIDTDNFTMKIAAGEDIQLEIKAIDDGNSTDEDGSMDGSLQRYFTITGREEIVKKLVNFCEKYYDDLKLHQTASATMLCSGTG